MFIIGFLLGLVVGVVPAVIFFQQSRVNDASSWSIAVSLLRSGQVEAVVQLHNGEVTLTLKDGTRFITKSPHLDDIFAEIARCGAPCEDILKVTE
jgi:hypothetical protein